MKRLPVFLSLLYGLFVGAVPAFSQGIFATTPSAPAATASQLTDAELDTQRKQLETDIANAPTGEEKKALRVQLSQLHQRWGLAKEGERKWDEAIAHYQQAYDINVIENSQLAALNVADMGIVYMSSAQYAKSLERFDQASKLFKEVAEMAKRNHWTAVEKEARNNMVRTLTNQGQIRASLGQYSEALKKYEEALPGLRLLKDEVGIASTLNNMGLTYFALKNYAKSNEYLKRSLPHWQNEKVGYYLAMSGIGGNYGYLGQFDQAFPYLNSALQFFEKQNNVYGRAMVLNNIGSTAMWQLLVYAKRRDKVQVQKCLDKSFISLNRSLILWKQLGDREGLIRLQWNMMELWEAVAKTPTAIFYGKQAVNSVQSIRADINSLPPQQQQSFLRTKEELYRRLADMLIEDNRFAEAQQVLEMLKDYEYFEFIRGDGEGTKKTDFTLKEQNVQSRDHQLQTLLIGLTSQLDTLRQRPTVQNGAQRKQLTLQLKAANQRYVRFLNSVPQLFGTTPRSQPVLPTALQTEQNSLRQLERSTRQKSAILYAVVAPNRYSVIVVGTRGKTVAYSTRINSVELAHMVIRFRNAIMARRDVTNLARELYGIVFCNGALEKRLKDLGATTLMWSLDGVLRYLPMSALHDGKSYLVERYNNQLFARDAITRLKDSPPVQWRALGVGTTESRTVAGQPFPALPKVENEIRAIVRDDADGYTSGVLPGTVRLNDRFSESEFMTQLRLGFPVVHIASHFRLRPGNNAQSYLLLGDKAGRGLTLAQIQSSISGVPLFQGVDLVTLSACETGIGDALNASNIQSATGAEVDSFGTLVQQAGAKAVMATLWQVADDSTAQLMSEFYRQRVANPKISKLVALRRAQLLLLHGKPATPTRSAARPNNPFCGIIRENSGNVPTFKINPNAPYAHPYYWAPFVLMGNWR